MIVTKKNKHILINEVTDILLKLGLRECIIPNTNSFYIISDSSQIHISLVNSKYNHYYHINYYFNSEYNYESFKKTIKKLFPQLYRKMIINDFLQEKE
jgi:YHS domain-containing protein